ncbi:MAG: ribosome silencing factor [Candidatus Sericytochromatia bacterium]
MTEQEPANSPHIPLLSDADIEQHLHAIEQLLDDKKALDLVSIDLRDKSTMADYFIVCSGNSKTHTRALAEAAHSYVKDAGLQIFSVEGKHEGSWVLLDVGFLVVHVMQQDLREFYNLEQLWSHAQQKNSQ